MFLRQAYGSVFSIAAVRNVATTLRQRRLEFTEQNVSSQRQPAG